MRILFASAQPFLPQIVGGVETSTIELARALVARGHEVASMNGIATGDGLHLRNRIVARLSGRTFPADSLAGVRVYRGWDFDRGLPEVVARFRPDAVVVQGGTTAAFEIARGCLRIGVPTFFYVHDVGPFVGGFDVPDLSGVRWIANSPYTRRVLAERLGVDSDVLPPCMDVSAYRTDAAGDSVTMVNPREKKGGPVALEVARRCPDIPFIFVEAWRGNDAAMREFRAKAAALPNASFLPAQRDMRVVYRRTRLLLSPSRLPETWGRVVTEAQASGIPAVVSDAGALPETLGPGGLVVPADAPVEAWVDAVRSIWDDAALYARFSEAARAFAARDEIAAGRVAAEFLALLARAVGTAS